MSNMKLYGKRGWGSVLVEAQLAWYDIPYEFVEVGHLFKDADAKKKLESINPAGQIPTLVLGDGTVMSESAAITLWLGEENESGDLVPGPGAPERARFLRWLFFMIGGIYPAYTYADDPARYVEDKAAQEPFADAVWDYARKLYLILNNEASAPWFLGERFSALDIYICAMTRWTPGRPWHEANTPKLVAIADATQAMERMSAVWETNFPDA